MRAGAGRLEGQALAEIRWATRVLAGASARRARDGAAACELLERYPAELIWDYWAWNRVRLLATHHARQAGLQRPAWEALESELAEATRQQAIEQELTAFKVTRLLAREGIKAVTFKGPVMAQRLRGHAELRDPSSDVDVLVSAGNLHRARALLEQQGWQRDGDPLLHGDLPNLHFAMRAPEGDHHVELHWRVQWHEARQHTDGLLERAVRTEGGLWVPADADLGEVLLLTWLRDGLHRLRLPSDWAALQELGASSGANAATGSTAPWARPVPASVPILAAPLAHGAAAAALVTGAPFAPPADRRSRLLAGIAARDRWLPQRTAFSRVAWVDVLAAPPGTAPQRAAVMLLRDAEFLRDRYPGLTQRVPVSLLRAGGLARTVAGARRALG